MISVRYSKALHQRAQLAILSALLALRRSISIVVRKRIHKPLAAVAPYKAGEIIKARSFVLVTGEYTLINGTMIV